MAKKTETSVKETIFKKYDCRVYNVLGTSYTIYPVEHDYSPYFEKNEALAFVDYSSASVYIDKSAFPMEESDNPDFHLKATIRHELLHAFMYESGLDVCSNDVTGWARNEEMIDWFAIQSPKIFKIYSEGDLL